MTKPCDPNIIPENCSVSDLVDCGIETETKVIDTSGTVIDPPPAPLGPNAIKVPRFLRRVVISGCIKSTIVIPGCFSEIKDIRKKVVVTQSKLICDELIVEGYILKDIKYVRPANTVANTNVCLAYPNCWFDISEKVPFTLCMTVTGLPTIYPTPNTSQVAEFNYLCDTMSDKCCDKGYMAPSPCETLRVETNYLNERPYSELVGYRIAELDLNNHRCPCPPSPNPCPPNNQCDCLYHSLTEKVKLDIVLDLYVLGIATSAAATAPVPPQPPFTGVCPPCNYGPCGE